jgi:hypothetical protein
MKPARAVAVLFPTPARIGTARTSKHPRACDEHSEQDRGLLAGKAGFDDQSTQLNFAVCVCLPFRGGHTSPTHLGPARTSAVRMLDQHSLLLAIPNLLFEQESDVPVRS